MTCDICEKIKEIFNIDFQCSDKNDSFIHMTRRFYLVIFCILKSFGEIFNIMITEDNLNELKITPGTAIYVGNFDSLKFDIEKEMNKISVNILEFTDEKQVIIFFDLISEMSYEFTIIPSYFHSSIQIKATEKITSLKEMCRERILVTLN